MVNIKKTLLITTTLLISLLSLNISKINASETNLLTISENKESELNINNIEESRNILLLYTGDRYNDFSDAEIDRIVRYSGSKEFLILTAAGYNHLDPMTRILTHELINSEDSGLVFPSINPKGIEYIKNTIKASIDSMETPNKDIYNFEHFVNRSVNLAKRLIEQDSSIKVWFTFPRIITDAYAALPIYNEYYRDNIYYAIKSEMEAYGLWDNVEGFYYGQESIGWYTEFNTASPETLYDNVVVQTMDFLSNIVSNDNKKFLWIPYPESYYFEEVSYIFVNYILANRELMDYLGVSNYRELMNNLEDILKNDELMDYLEDILNNQQFMIDFKNQNILEDNSLRVHLLNVLETSDLFNFERVGYIANTLDIFDYVLLQPNYYWAPEKDFLPLITESVKQQAVVDENFNIVSSAKTSETKIGMTMELDQQINEPSFFERFDAYVNTDIHRISRSIPVPIAFYAEAPNFLMRDEIFNRVSNFFINGTNLERDEESASNNRPIGIPNLYIFS